LGFNVKRTFSFVFLTTLAFAGNVGATEIMPWITPTGVGGVAVDVYYASSAREVKFTVESATVSWQDEDFMAGRQFFDSVDIPVSYVTASPIVLMLSLRPGLGFSPYVKMGILNSEIRQNVQGGESKWTGGYNGYVCGAGFRYVLSGDGRIREQVFLDAGLTRYFSKFNTYTSPASQETTVHMDIGIWEFHYSLIVMKQVNLFCTSDKKPSVFLSPYGGANMTMDWGVWKDNIGTTRLEGNASAPHLLAGLAISVKSVFNAKVELSLLGEPSISAGAGIEIGL